MKILMLNHEFPPVGGGAAPVTLELCRQLVQMGHQVDVVTMHFGELEAHETIDGVNIYRTWAIRKKPNICHTHEMATYLPGALFKTLRLAKKQKYDVIHCHFIIPGGPLAWLVSRIRKIPFLVTIHGSDIPGYNPDRFTLMHRLLKPGWKFLIKRADMIVSPSVSLKMLTRKSCPNLEIEAIPNGIYASQLRPAGNPKQNSILLCSRLLPRKGFQHVIQAVHDLDTGWQVDIIGEGPYRGELERLAEGSKTPVRFWGWLDQRSPQFKKLYESGSIFVFTSEAENFPTVLLEAMSAKMAIITSTAGGCPEVVGQAGLLVEAGDVNAIRENICRLIEDTQLRKSLADAAIQRVEQFSWPYVANRYVECYRQIIDRAANG